MAQQQQFTTNGAFTVPAGVLSINVECVGAGGAGGRVTSSNIFDKDAAGGGGGGAYAAGIVAVTENTSYQVTVGIGGKNDGTSVDGGSSFFHDGSSVKAVGGKTCSGNDEVLGAEGGKAVNSNGSIRFNGGNGGEGVEDDADGGGGGGGAGSLGNGLNGSTVNGGGNKANYGGFGGNGGPDGATGSTGGNYGGGGGGSSANGGSNRDGGQGAPGIVVIHWSAISDFNPKTVCSSGTITLQGVNFSTTDSVKVAGQLVAFTVVSDTEMTLQMTNSVNSGVITVYTQHGACKSAEPVNIISSSIQVTAQNGILTSNFNSTGNETYQWYNCITNQPIPTATGASYTPTVNGIYKLVVTAGNCTPTSACFTFNSLGIEELSGVQIVAFPNPTTGTVNLAIDAISYAGMSCTLTDVTGKIYVSSAVNSANESFDLGSFSAGVYFAIIRQHHYQKVIQINLTK